MYYGFYDQIGGSPQGVVRTLVTDPGAVLGALFEVHDIVYVIWLGLPLLFLFLLSPALAAVALPQLLANTLSDFRSMTDPRYHSVAAVVPFLIAATVFGIARLSASRRALATGGSARVLSHAELRARPLAAARRRDAARRSRRHPVAIVRRRCADAVALVPTDAPVTASNTARWASVRASSSSTRCRVLGRAEWAVVDRADPWVVAPRLADPPPIIPSGSRRSCAGSRRIRAGGRSSTASGVVVLRRTAS